MRSETVIACDFVRGIVLIGGTSYAGEIKKSVFSYLNYTLPAKGVLPPNYASDAFTENTRGAYPPSYIPGASLEGIVPHPKHIVMLTADAFGVLPPISRLTPGQAEYHFLSGYTTKVAGTEKGIVEPSATFSTCFGAPFMSRHPTVYGKMLRELMATHNVNCWLVNTGWTGGKYGVGRRMSLPDTRALVNLALAGKLNSVPWSATLFSGSRFPRLRKG